MARSTTLLMPTSSTPPTPFGVTVPFAAVGLLGVSAVADGAATGSKVSVIGGKLTGKVGSVDEPGGITTGGIVTGGRTTGGTITTTGGGAPTLIITCVSACAGVAVALVAAGKL